MALISTSPGVVHVAFAAKKSTRRSTLRDASFISTKNATTTTTIRRKSRAFVMNSSSSSVGIKTDENVVILANRRKIRDTAKNFRSYIDECKQELISVDTKEIISGGSDQVFGGKQNGKRTIVLFLTQLADFDSWEQAKFIVNDLPRLEAANVNVIAFGLGSVQAGEQFCERTKFPKEKLIVTSTSRLYRKMEYSPGFGDALPVKLPGMVKLLVMCAGIGSPGTLKTVISGYFGSKNKPPVLVEGSNADVPEVRKLMDATLGAEYLRPFEMATLRLANMTEILNNWDDLVCEDDQLLVQRGGSMVLDEEGEIVFDHVDPGILGYCDPKRLTQFALLESDPKAPFDAISVMHEACETKNVNVEDVCDAIAACEKSKFNVTGDMLNGEWELVYTTGTNKNKANVNRNGDGTYFPIKAVQSFDIKNERIRNGVYVGPIKFFFDGPFIWRQNLKMLEFTFTKCSVGVFSFVKCFDIDDGKWDAVKATEEKTTEGQGKITKSSNTSSKSGANPFFKFVYADEKCVAARGRGGGLAMWKAVGPPQTDAET
ncbi:unnamed protein product [Bathycoccus prasinos]